MKKITVLSALFLAVSAVAASEARPLTAWAELTPANAVRVVNRLDPVSDHLAGGKTGRNDDEILIDFMDYASQKGIRECSGLTFEGEVPLGKLSGAAAVRNPSEIDYAIELETNAPHEVKESFFSIRFSRPVLDREVTFTLNGGGKPYLHKVMVPASHAGGWIWSSPAGQTAQKISIPLMHGALELSGFDRPVMVCKYGANTGNIRIYLDNGKQNRITGKITVAFRPYPAKKLDLSQVVNVGFADETADDGKGGWTDQGPGNDMRLLPVGAAVYGNIGFDVIDPARNGGKSALAFANPARSYFLKDAELKLDGARFDWLYLFHAAAWCQGGAVGSIRVEYADGSGQDISVEDRRDVGNWWGGMESYPNATLVWRSQNQNSLIGLYLSRFRVENKPIAKIVFKTANRSVWLVAAATGVAGNPPFPGGSDVEVPYAVEAGKDYKAFTFHKDRVPGSALDFSGTIDAPAGKYGRVVIRDGKFFFENRQEKPARFLGANICSDANYLEYAQTDVLVDRIVKAGYNAVRFHHFDQALIRPGATSPEFDPERLDRLFYLFAKCKERGLYVTIDLYISRTTGFDRAYRNMFDIKTRMLFSPELRANLKEYSKRLLTTVNPYTKMAMKDDPALITVGLINEDPTLTVHREYQYPNPDPERNAMMKPVFEAWCVRTGNDPGKVEPKMWMRFLLDNHVAVYNELKEFLRGIGVGQPLSDISCGNPYALTLPRNAFDYVDNHFYFDHPTFPLEDFKMPFQNHDRSAVSNYFMETLRCGASRIAGKPFTVTEYNFCIPNRHRSEGGAAMGALAAFQEWDGIFRFQFIDYSRDWKNVEPLGDGGHLGSFSVANDPILAFSELIAAMFYLRGDVSPARESLLCAITPEVWKDDRAAAYRIWGTRLEADYPEAFLRYGLSRKIGMTVLPAGTQVPKGVRMIESFFAEKPVEGEIISSTGEISTDAKAGTFRVVTPKSEALVVPGRTLAGKSLRVDDSTVFATVFAGALDDRPLPESKRILVLHLTDVKATGQKFGMFRNELRMYNWGNFSPYLVRRGSAKITLALGDGKFLVRSLGVEGGTVKEETLEAADGRVSFQAATDAGPENCAVFAYEVIRR